MSVISKARVFFAFSLLLLAVSAEDCDKTKCPGPVRYYEELKCKPTYAKDGDCCAASYDCTHLSSRSVDKCYANGKEYNVGETMKDEDRINPCDIACFCAKHGEVAKFTCAIVDCFRKPLSPGCYWRPKLDSCCGGEEICPEKPDDRLKCDVNGKTYMDGERFYAPRESNKLCQCMEGYEGKNEAPFCRKATCGLDERYSEDIHGGCAPIYENSQNPAVNCQSTFRCPTKDDAVANSNLGDEKRIKGCGFGEMELYIGDELKESSESFHRCVQCTCDVPPTLTCKRLSDEECNVKYPKESK